MLKKDLDVLFERYIEAKKKMAACSAEADLALENLLPFLVKTEEGTTHTHGENYDAVTSYRLTIKIDDKKLADVEKNIPQAVYQRLFTFRPAMSVKEFKKIKEYDEETYRQVLPALTFTPAKPSIEINPIERN